MAAEQRRALGAMLITAPSEHERTYELAVRLTKDELIAVRGYALQPWIRITANLETERVELGAGVTAKRMP